jgi:hypothetical protein
MSNHWFLLRLITSVWAAWRHGNRPTSCMGREAELHEAPDWVTAATRWRAAAFSTAFSRYWLPMKRSQKCTASSSHPSALVPTPGPKPCPTFG